MTKIEKISVQNFKAIAQQEINFTGCSAIITGANNSGKTSLLKGLFDRINSKKPEIILKKGEANGFYSMQLTDGSKIDWKFTEKGESLQYTTKEGFTLKQGVIEALQKKYFGIRPFDIERFLNSTPKEQKKQLCTLIGLDFTEIDARYKTAFNERTEKNAILNALRNTKKEKPVPVEMPDLQAIETAIELEQKNIDSILFNIREENKRLRENWHNANETERIFVENWNKEQQTKLADLRDCTETIKNVNEQIKFLNEFKIINIDLIDLEGFIKSLPISEPLKEFTKLPEPEYKNEEPEIYGTLNQLKSKSVTSHAIARNYAVYQENLKQYNEWIESGKNASLEQQKADEKVKAIEKEKNEMIASAKMPAGFTFSGDDLLYNGFTLDKQTQSTSALYIAGLKLATMNLGELSTIHFDASFLDKNSLQEIENYANSIDLQLLIERPDFEAGEIKYQIISE